MTVEVSSFQCVRARASAFCIEREWTTFHTPVNLALALSGECGEISEIFQWKGPLEEGIDNFSSDEIVHIGEEISDVFIYSTRLCDMCGIDLAYSVRHCAAMTHSLQYSTMNPSDIFVKECSSSSTSTSINPKNSDDVWDTLTFTELDNIIPKEILEIKSPRAIALSIQSRCGRICELFVNKTEYQSFNGLPGWPKSEVAELALIIGTICILLSTLARISNITLNKCLSDKISKNEAKYPVEMVKGSSAKYTVYADSIKKLKMKKSDKNNSDFSRKNVVVAVLTLFLSVGVGYMLGGRGGRGKLF